MKLIVIDNGDWSVGIPSKEWSIDCPFETDEDKEVMEQFKIHILDAYSVFSNVNITAQYDFEIEAENKYLDGIEGSAV